MTVRVLGYGRVSTVDQEISPEVQEKQCRQWYDSQAERGEWNSESKFVGMIVDKAVSGKVELFKRPQGQHILTTLRRGDVLVASKLSRAFRSTQDMLHSFQALQEIGIRLVLLDISVDTSTPTGKLMLTVLAAIAEFERELIAERTREALRHRMSEGQYVGTAPPGWTLRTKSQSRGRDNELVPDHDTRLLGKYAAKRISEGTSIDQVALEINTAVNNAPEGWAEARRHKPNKSGGDETKSGPRKRAPYSSRLMTVWAVYHICGWPPLSKSRLLDKLGPDTFTVAYVVANYKSAPELVS